MTFVSSLISIEAVAEEGVEVCNQENTYGGLYTVDAMYV